MHKQHRIAISGKAKSGKDTVAKMLCQHLKLYKEDIRINAFANPIKQMMEIMFPFLNKECLYGSSEKREEAIADEYGKITYRDVLIDIGTIGRKYSVNTWLYPLEKDFVAFNNKLAYIVSDIRFYNEYMFLKQRGFYLIRVLRKDQMIIDDASEKAQEEITDDKFDFIIHNNDTLENLDRIVQSIVLSITTNQ